MSKAAQVPDSVGPFLRAMRRSAEEFPGVSISDSGNMLLQQVAKARAQQKEDEEPEAIVLRLARPDVKTPAEQLLRESGLSMIVFARALQSLRDTGLVQISDEKESVTVQATALGRQLVQP